MDKSSQIFLQDRYENICELVKTEQEIDQFLIKEGLGDALSTAKEILTNLPKFVNDSMPEFINKFFEWLKHIGIAGLASTGGVYVLGKLIIFLSKKIAKTSAENEKQMMDMLPQEAYKEIQSIQHLKETNFKEYAKQFKKINERTLNKLKQQFKSAGMNTEQGILSKSLEILGKTLSYGPVPMIVGILLTYKLSALGFLMQMPAIPKLVK